MSIREKEALGLKSAARFALQPNMWGFCGEDDSQQCLREFVSGREKDVEKIRLTLEEHGFPHLNAFLETIAKSTGRDRFDPEMVLNYWLGGEVVGTREDLLENYSKYFPKEFVEALGKVLPEKIYLTHLSQVIFVAAADYQGVEKINLINHCMITGGEVVEIDTVNRVAVVQRDILNKDLKLVKGKQSVKIDPDLTPKIEVGNKVAVHLGYLASTLTTDEADSLSYWTDRVVSETNPLPGRP